MILKKPDFDIEILTYELDPDDEISCLKFLWQKKVRKATPTTSRAVYIGNNYVFKFDMHHGEKFYSQCWAESKVWQRYAGTECGKSLVPILAHGNEGNIYWVVQPRVEIVRTVDRKLYKDICEQLNEIEKNCQVGDLFGPYLQDANVMVGNNWTVRNGKVLIYDYGINSEYETDTAAAS